MNESIYSPHTGRPMHFAVVDLDDLPDPPDNLEEWEKLPEDFRETVSERFETGISNEWQLNCDRADNEDRVRDLRRSGRRVS